MRKRVLSILLSVAMVLSLLPTAVFADEVDGTEGTGETGTAAFATGDCGADGSSVTWTLTENETVGTYTLTIDGEGNMADYATGGAQPWVNQRAGVEHVVIGDGVTSIGERAFMGFSALKDVVIPDSVTSYGTNAFHGCTSLSTLNIGKNVSSIGQIGIYLDTAMTVLTIDAQNDSYAVIDNWLYELNDDDTAYLWQVPAGVVKDAATITVPDTIDWNGKSYTVVGVGKANADSYTLAGAASVTSVDLSSNVKEIGANAFHGAVELENIDISRVTAIGTAAFKDCTKLTAATFADGLTTIGGNAFAGTGLTEVKLPAALTYLGKYVFSGCEDLKTVIIKSDTLEICSAAFNADKKLEVLDLSAVKNLTLDIKDPLAINRQDAVLLICYVAGETQKTLLEGQFSPNSVALAVTNGGTFPEGTVFESGKLATPTKFNSVFKGWFENADFSGDAVTSDTTLTAGTTYYAKWEKIAMKGNCGESDHEEEVQWAFSENENVPGTYTLTISGTGNMADFTQPTKPDEVGASIAPWYTALADLADKDNHTVPITEVVVENGVTGLGNWAFAYTQVTEAKFTSSVTRYGIRIYSNCAKLTTVNWNGFKPAEVKLAEGDDGYFKGCAIPSNIFDSDSKLNTCIVGGTTYVDKVAVPAEVVAVGTSGFYGTAFRTVDFENNLPNVKQIGYYSFASMQNLESLTIPGYMKFVLGGKNNNLSNAFAEEFSATSLVVGEGMKVLPASVAREWRSMQTLRLPSTLTDIGNSAFANAKQLHSVDMSKIVGPITVDISFNTYKSASGEFPVDCIFYVNNSGVQSTLANDNWGNRNNNNSNSSRVIYAVTNGGTFSDETVFTAGTLAEPKKTGYDFKGWFDNKDCTGTAVKSFESGKVYYAKWVKAEPGDLKPDFSAYTVRVMHADRTYREYALNTEGGFTDNGLAGNAKTGFTYSITVDPAVFIALYNADKTDGNHVKTSGSTSMTLTWRWENGSWKPVADSKVQATIKVKHEIPVFLFFKTVDSNGDLADLSAADLARAGLQKDRLNGDDWYCYVKLTSNAALPTVQGTTYTDKDAEFKAVLDELAAADTTAERHDDSKNFTLGDKIVWTDLNYNPSTHGGWNSYSIGYHMDGTLTVYNVTFNANGGTVSADVSGYYVKGADLTLPTPVREGYTFAGWDLGGFRYTSENDHNVPVTGDWTFVAQWEANTYTVRFDANGGEGTMDAQTFTYDVAQSLTANAFTRTGYNFAGWNTKSDGTGEKYSDGQTVKNLTAVNDGNVNLYAQWEVRVPVGSAELVENLPEGTYGEAYTGSVTANKTFTDEDCVKLVLLDAEGNVLNTTDIGSGLTYVNGAVSGTPTAAGTVTFTVALLNVENQIVCRKTCTITVNKAAIASVDLDVTAPAVGNKPQDTVTAGTGYTASISWSPAHDPFDFNTAYTATVTLTPDENHSFDGTEFPDGWTLDGLDETTGAVKLKKTFDKTDMDTVKTPVIDPNGGFFTGGTTVRITCATEGAVIHYTTDGTTPTANSPVYTGPLNIYQTLTVKAIAVKNEFYDSAVASAEFTLFAPVDPSTCTLIFSTNGGSVIPNVTAPKGTVISLAGYVPTKTGYTFGGWYLDAALTQPVAEVTLTGTTTVYAKWTEDVQANFPFTDVKTGDWFYEGVDYVWANGLMNGVSADTFDPYANTTRGMIVTVLARMEGVNTAGTLWYAAGREWAMANGVSDGTNMEAEITREQLATMLYRCAQLKGCDVSATVELISFTDADQVSGWAEDAMKWAVANGLIKGRSDALAPKDKATRGEVATVLMRFRETVGK